MTILLISCQSKDAPGPNTTLPNGTLPSIELMAGNLNRNLSNWGIYAENDGWIWFSDTSKGYQLSRMKLDGSELQSYDAAPVKDLNIVGNQIYFLQNAKEQKEGEDFANLYRMDITGIVKTEVAQIKPGFLTGCLVAGDWIFFANAEDDHSLYRIKTDGSDLKKLNDIQTWRLNLDDGWIFYLAETLSDNGSQIFQIHKIRPDGTEDIVLVENVGAVMLADSGWLYYTDQEGHLCRIKYDKSGYAKLTQETISSLNLDQNSLYYVLSETQMLMTSQLDGTNQKQLLDFPSSGVQIAGGWLYYRNQTGRVYRMKPDGSGKEITGKIPMVQPDPPGTQIVTGLGSINANFNGGSFFVQKDEWIYGNFLTDNRGIYRMKVDGTQTVSMSEKDGYRFNLVGDWLYFQSDYSCIARIKTDGTHYEVIHDSADGEIIVRDNWIYFVDTMDQHSLFKIKTDGTELTRLSEGPVQRLFLEDEWLYWSGIIDRPWETQNIYRVRTDGTEETLLVEEIISSITVGDGYIFYRIEGEEDSNDHGKNEGTMGGGTVHRVDMDGSDDIKIISGELATLSGFYKGWLYYFNGNEEEGLIRVRPDGSDRKVLIGPGNYVWVHFLGDQIIFYDNAMNRFRSMDLDGNNLRELDY